MTKSFDTLVDDIYEVLSTENEVNEDFLKALGEDIVNVVRDRLEAEKGYREPYLRCSNLGRKDRQLYYDLKETPEEGKYSVPKPSDQLKFLYGDIIEALLIFLAKQAGHTVESEQEEIDIDGVKGHMDCMIDRKSTV